MKITKIAIINGAQIYAFNYEGNVYTVEWLLNIEKFDKFTDDKFNYKILVVKFDMQKNEPKKLETLFLKNKKPSLSDSIKLLKAVILDE